MNTKKTIVEPQKRPPLCAIPRQDKAGTFMKTYYKGFSNFWTGRQYVLEYEETTDSELQ